MELISRQEAIRRGLDRYFTGIPCKHGHVSERTIRGACRECIYLFSKNRNESMTPEQRAQCRAKAKLTRIHQRAERMQTDTDFAKKIKLRELHKKLREEALANGSRFYYTGQPCYKGHICQTYTHGGRCVQCVQEKHAAKSEHYVERTRQWRIANKDRHRNYMREYHQRPERKHRARIKPRYVGDGEVGTSDDHD